jgi:hypothetical protein
MTVLMILASLLAAMDFGEEMKETELLKVSEPMFATDPGHMVFAQYITSDNCGFCMSYGSPAHKKLKVDWPATYTYVSLHSASYGNTADAESGNINPILAVSHLQQSGGAPKTSFGDDDGDCCDSNGNRIDTTYFKSGCGTNVCWDTPFSSGGGTHSTVGDYTLNVGQSDNGDGTSDITITVSYVGAGSAPLSSYTLYAAVTENVCNSHAYTDGTKGGHCWEAWLLNGGAYVSNSGNVGGGTGFETISLASGTASASWTVPNGLVANGASNMLTVGALYSGWSTSNGDFDVFTAADSSMAPLIDVSAEDVVVTNQDGLPGFLTGDTLDLEVTVKNKGADEYTDGGTISLYWMDGGNDVLIDSIYLNSLDASGAGSMQTFTASFETSSIQMVPNGNSMFKAVISGLTDDGNGGNNLHIGYAQHDFTPSAHTPIADGMTTLPRGGSLDFDATGMSNDNVDTMLTMTPELEVSPTGSGIWSSSWVSGGEQLIAAGTPNERYVFTVTPVNTASSGDYDARLRFTDARGQVGEWTSMNEAFELLNGLPFVIDPSNPDAVPDSCDEYTGIPTVKVETNERVSLNGLICDAETDISQLSITSNDPSFIAWYAADEEIEVHFDTLQWDAMGNPLPQGITVSMNDGEDTNTGMLRFNVIENGQPRWQSIPAQSFDEGIGVTIQLTQFLTDTDEDGTPVSVSGLSLSVVSMEPANIVSADIFGQSLSVNALDDDAFGSVVLTLRADDGLHASDTEVHVHVQNINDAPRLDATDLAGLMVQTDDTLEINLGVLLSDVDDPDDEIWTTVQASPAGAAQYNPISGILMLHWEIVGEQNVYITATDAHGDSGVWSLMVEVVDALPLAWSTDGSNGDLDVAVVNLYIGDTPNVYIVQLSDLQLSDIRIEWQICNTETGICNDFGAEAPTGAQLMIGQNFDTEIISGPSGLQMYDQLKIVVTAIDSNGFDRESSWIMFDATTEQIDGGTTDGGDNNDDNTGSGSDDETSSKGGSSMGLIIGAVVVVVILVVLAVILSLMLLGGSRAPESVVEWGAEASFTAPGAPQPAMAASAGAETAPDYTHLPAGGNYVTGEGGETVYLAPNGTAWAMQADNSFVRTQ